MTRLKALLPLVALLVSSCAGLARNDQGNLQPQTVRGPCDVKKFFLLGLRSVPTDLTIRNTGEACTFTLLNPDLQIVLTAALVTMPPSHGRATAELVSGNRQGLVSYAPAPGYHGTDRFAVTFEPNATGVTLNVTVQ